MKTYQELEAENLVLTEQLKFSEERAKSLTAIIERLTNLTNRLLLKFQNPAEK